MSEQRSHSYHYENKQLRDSLLLLQEQVLQADAREKKAVNELQCLIKLVREAWAGDTSAVIHVANIVGVLPPDITESSNGQGIVIKSRAVNNWAILALGLLNAEYCKQEQILHARQNMYLTKRKHYLNEQLNFNHTLVEKVQRRPKRILSAPPLRQRRNSMSDIQEADASFITQPGPRNDSNVNCRLKITNGLKKPTNLEINGKPPSSGRPLVKHLYRPATTIVPHTTPRTKDIDLCWEDIVTHPLDRNNSVNKTYNTAFKGLVTTSSATINSNDQEKQTTNSNGLQMLQQTYIEYDNPSKYCQDGLFQCSDSRKPSRPCSAVQQRQNDRMRSRPRSAVSEASGRPLKYETTRPISGSKQKPRRPSSSKTDSVINKLTEKNSSTNPPDLPPEHEEEDEITELQPVKYPTALDFHLHDLEMNDTSPRPDSNRIPSTRLRPPDSVVKFQKDLESMSMLEKHIKQTTVELQKKLGISEKGIVY